MQKNILYVLSSVAFSWEAWAQAPAGGALVQQYGCLNCHNVEQKLVGPAYKAVSEKYRSDREGASLLLAKKIKAGGAGNWGRIPMPPHPNVTDEDAKQIVAWILNL